MTINPKKLGRSPFVALSFLFLLLGGVFVTPKASLSQNFLEKVPFPAGQVPDHLKSFVIGTRFVRGGSEDHSPREKFEKSRVDPAAFNPTDTCIDNEALKVAEAYFRTLGRMLEHTKYYYELPKDDTDQLISTCENKVGAKAKEIYVTGTKIMAFGHVLPTADAPELERSLR